MTRVAVACIAAWTTLVPLAVCGTAAAASLDDGQPGPGMKYTPGVVLVRFADGTDGEQRAADAKNTGTTVENELPLVPELYALRIPAGETVQQAEADLAKHRDVVYAQPDLVERDTTDVLPNDPYFGPSAFANKGGCSGSSKLGEWALWPRNQNLEPDNAMYDQYWSINVVPVWDALTAAGRPAGKTGQGADGAVWSTGDIHRSAVGVYDTGLSDNPDIAGQVAALFSTVTLDHDPDNPATAKAFEAEVHRDDPNRPDLAEVKQAVDVGAGRKVNVYDANRPLFALDDANVLEADRADAGKLPSGCDGHGTGVASVAAADTNNGTGIAGVGYNVPIVGVRPGMPWDIAGTTLASDDRLSQAVADWKQNWRDDAISTTENQIDDLATFSAMHVPVVNASRGSKLFESGPSQNGKTVPVVRNPAVDEAYARLFSNGRTLGVVAAGNSKENYGSGPRATGAHVLFDQNGGSAVEGPCGLPLLRNRDLAVHEGTGYRPWRLDIPWNKLLLLCVGATTSNGSGLASFSGYGTSAVNIAAPGEAITAASRPRQRRAGGVDPDSYANQTGTSLSAPMIAGAAALLREAAPNAPMPVITAALLHGAQPVQALLNKVSYGQLDVACSLEWLEHLQSREHVNWDLVGGLNSEEFATATAACARKASYRVETTLEVPTSRLYGDANKSATISELLADKHLDDSAKSRSLAWQRLILFNLGITRPIQGRAIFRMGSTPRAEVPAGGGAVYDLGKASVVCARENFRLSGLTVKFLNAIRPIGWFYPTDAAPPQNGVELGVVAEKPWFSGFISSPLKLQVRGTCSYFG
jgi:hypothetical protein